MSIIIPSPDEPLIGIIAKKSPSGLIGIDLATRRCVALSGLDLKVRAGEVMALIGTNGAGKSTAISLLLGLNVLDDASAESVA